MSQLAANLQEMYVAIHENKDVVPNYRGTHVYHVHSFLGRVWTVIFRLLSFFHLCEQDLQKKNLRQAIEKTQEIFEKKLTEVFQFGSHYQKFLNSKKISSIEEKVCQARKEITEWNEAVGPFVTLLEQEVYKTHLYVKPFTANFSKLSSKTNLTRLQYVINLEHHLGEPLPLNLLAQLAREEKGDVEALQRFIKCVHASQVKIGLFHEGLACFLESLEDDKASLAQLEYQLWQAGLELFYKRDEEHVAWKNSLKPGQCLTCNRKEIVLGEQIGKKINGEDNTAIFVNKTDPATVIIIGKNRAVAGIRKIGQENVSWGIPSSKIIEIEDRGRFMIVERLKEPLSGHRWTSDKSLACRDEEILQPIVNWIRWMVDQKCIPGELYAERLMFNARNQLRSAKIHSKGGDFNFVALENFCFDVAKENVLVFSTLMEKSGLRKFPPVKVKGAFFEHYANYYSKFFKEILQHALSQDDTVKEDGIRKYLKLQAHDWCLEPDFDFFKHMVSFYNEVLALKRECLEALMRRADNNIRGAIDKDIAKEIENFYDETHAVTRLWPSMKKVVIEKITEGRQLSHVDR